MKSDRLLLIVGVIALLSLGIFLAQLVFPPIDVSVPPNEHGSLKGLWQTRQADLVIQLGLMFVGALGIRALLPDENERD